MIVGYVLDRFPSLHQTFVLNEMLALQDLGIALVVFSLKPPVGRVHDEMHELGAPVIYAPPLRRFERYGLSLSRSLTARPATALHSAGTALTSRRRIALTNWLRGVQLAPEARRHGVDHLHAHFATGANVAAMFMAELNGISFSFTTHAVDLYARPVMLCQSLRRATFGVTISDYNRRFVAETCGPELAERVAVVRAGIDAGRFASGARSGGEGRRATCPPCSR